MEETKPKSKRSTKSTSREFTRAHEHLLSGMIGAKMSAWDCFQATMALKTEKKAVEVLQWMFHYVGEHKEYPTPAEIKRKVSEVTGCRFRA